MPPARARTPRELTSHRCACGLPVAALDRNLAKETKAAEAVKRREEEDARIYKQAEKAALEAKKY